MQTHIKITLVNKVITVRITNSSCSVVTFAPHDAHMLFATGYGISRASERKMISSGRDKRYRVHNWNDV